jgi:beta-xylosidase
LCHQLLKMKHLSGIMMVLIAGLISQTTFSQSSSFKTYINPVIPGDHADATLTRIGNDFYTTGSSFNVTPVIFHSRDLVHWEAIARPVSAAWANFGNAPGGGCWGGQIVYHGGKYWDYFSRANTMYFVSAGQPEGPWNPPVKVNNPPALPYGLGYDNSIFIDDDNKWYLVVKNGQPNNGIVELGDDGQPTGTVHNLDWLNPAPSYPYSWAEGPVMWKANGYYYYSFARDLAGGQKVMRSRTLTAEKSAWELPVDFFNQSDPLKPGALFTEPNHSSAPVMLDDSTWWVIHPLYAKGEWKGQGRQGLLNQVRYNTNLMPVADYPVNKAFNAPSLASGGIPWMVPHTDYFSQVSLNPEWSFLGYTPEDTWSLSDRPGWIKLSPNTNRPNTILKNDGEHNYSLITKLDFDARSVNDEAGLRIIRGDETKYARLFSSFNSAGKKVIVFTFDSYRYETENKIGDTLWLKIIRVNHALTGFYSQDGIIWTQVGNSIDISTVDAYSDFTSFTGTRQGIYVQNSPAWFDLYIYRDAYTPIMAGSPANWSGTAGLAGGLLDQIHNNDWSLYAGVEFGDGDGYDQTADSVLVTASAIIGGAVEIWLDSIESGTLAGTCEINPTGSLSTFKLFKAPVQGITGNHDVYLRFTGTLSEKLFVLKTLQFHSVSDTIKPIAALPDTTFHIYLMFGQSNMEGQGTVEAIDRVTNPRVFVLQDSTCPNLGREYGKWYIAEPPLNRCWGKLGPGDSFGRMLGEKAPSWVSKIGLVNVSVSGCNIFIYKKGCPDGLDQYSQGIPFNCGYTWLLDLAKKASRVGVIKGIIFHQGETNTSDPNWKFTVQQIVADLKADLGIDDIPFLAGELLYAEYRSCCSAHNVEINKLPAIIPNAHVISAAGLPGADNAHFTSASYRTFGERYAQKMLNLVYGICDSTTIESWYKGEDGILKKSNDIRAHHGTTLLLSPRPSNLLGSWNWTGAGTSGTNREQTIIVPADGTYRAVVTYTNECGAKSRIPVTIRVCDSTLTESWYKVDDGSWISSDTVIALRYSDLFLRPLAADTAGTWSWSGAGLSGSSQEQKFNTSFAGKYRTVATYTNKCGSSSRLDITIKVCDSTRIESWYQINGASAVKSDSVRVNQNSALTLTPRPVSGGSWNWSGVINGTSREQIINTQNPGIYKAMASYTNVCGLVSHMKVKVVVEQVVDGNENLTVDKIKVYPNPSSDRLNIITSQQLNIKVAVIMNEAGHTVMNLRIKSGALREIDISKLTPGVYYLRILTDKDIVVTKFVKGIR